MNQSSFPQRGVFLVFLSFSLTALYGDSSGLAAKCVRRAAGIRTVTGWVWGPGVRAIWTTPRLPLLGVWLWRQLRRRGRTESLRERLRGAGEKERENDSWGGHQGQRAGLGVSSAGGERRWKEEGKKGDLRSVLLLTVKPCIYPDPSNETETLLLTGDRNEALKNEMYSKREKKNVPL